MPTIVKVVAPSGSVPAPKKLHVVVAFGLFAELPLVRGGVIRYPPCQQRRLICMSERADSARSAQCSAAWMSWVRNLSA